MPLPLPDLDDRRWADLVEEARALIPQLAPAWTDLNFSDPGITLIELLAALTEQDVFAVDRIPASHRARFTDLTGTPLRPARPALTPLVFATTSAAPLRIPVGTVLTADTGGELTLHSLLAADGGPDVTAVTVWGCPIVAVRSSAGSEVTDRTADVRHGAPFAALGPNPQPGAALMLGLGLSPVFPSDARLSLWFGLDDAATAGLSSHPAEVPPDAPHHGFMTAWEWFDGSQWRAFAGRVLDETRALSRSGRVVLPVGTAGLPPAVLEAQTGPLRWVRVRAAAGRPDVAPIVRTLAGDAAPATQTVPLVHEWRLAPDHEPIPGWLATGARAPLALATSRQGEVLAIDAGAAGDPAPLVVPAAPGRVGLTLAAAGVADGAPAFTTTAGDGVPLLGGTVRVWTSDSTGCRPWRVVASLHRSTPESQDVLVDHLTGTLTFGDGERGMYPRAGETVLVAAELTRGTAGTPTQLARWSIAHHPVTGAVTGLAPIDPRTLTVAALPGRAAVPADDLRSGRGRAARAVWAHERLVETAPLGTLDQLDRAAVLALTRPGRAVTLVDYERIALEVPGTAIRRSRAWAELDPALPGLIAEGTVTVVVVPGLPVGRPTPTPATLAVIRRWLCPRRSLGTRLVVTGPTYLEVTIRAQVRALPGVDRNRVAAAATARLHAFFDPLTGGPAGHGWPFGRDIHRAEVMSVLDAVPGVDYVSTLEMSAPGREPGCGSLCLGPTHLVASGQHEVVVS